MGPRPVSSFLSGDSAPRAAQARALAPCKLAVFFGSDFLALIETEGKPANRILLRLSRHLGQRLRASVLGQSTEQHL